MLVTRMAKKKPKARKPVLDPKALDFFREMGRRGGKKGGQKGGKRGGKARWAGVPPAERSAIARRAVLARWRKKQK